MRDSGGSRPRPRSAFAGRRAKLTMTAMSAAVCVLAAACSATSSPTTSGSGKGKAAAKPAAATPASLTISPANGATVTKTNAGVSVAVANGKISNVTVSSAGSTVPGSLNAAGTQWHSDWPLHNGANYTVHATATGGDGKQVAQTSTFKTVAAGGTFYASTFEGYQQTYGVGMPIMITFSQPVTRKAAVERAIQITSSNPVVGAWMWDGNQTLDFRPRTYWPQHTEVSFYAHFNGLEAAPGVYGSADLSQKFKIGNSLIVVASTRTHYQMVYYKNKVLGRWPISTGQPGDNTANGTYLTIDKHNPTRMVGNGYNVLVPLAVRFTWSGNYEHWAAWSVAQQGHVNVSHGCVNLSPAHAAIYYRLARPGDPVTITGSPVAGKWDDGWTEWFLSFNQVVADSATHMAVQVGPTGSTFVSPSTLPTVTTNVLNSSRTGNYLAK